MKLKKVDWAANTMILTGVVGLLYLIRMLQWHEKFFIWFSVSMIIGGLRYYAGDSASQNTIRVIYILFDLIVILFIVLGEILD